MANADVHVNGNSAKQNGHAAAAVAAKGPGLDHQKLISRASLMRPESPIRSLFPQELIPGMLSFLAGKPNSSTFPLAEISMTLKPDTQCGTQADGVTPTQLSIVGDELDMALQYGATPGLAPLVNWLVGWQSHFNKRPIVKPGTTDIRDGHNPWTLHVGNGSQDFLTKVFNTLINPGDSCLVERPVYAGLMPNLVVLQADIVAVESDEQGMMASHLRSILEGWTTNEETKHKSFPKFVLTTPTGANPSGTTAGEQRKRDVLQAAREFGLLIIEDDPYAMLAFEGLDNKDCEPAESRVRCRTYWSLEQDEAAQWGTGWVLRIDSFSKVLSAGIRMAFLTGPPLILKYIESETSTANLQPSGVAQIITYKLLQLWGYDGFLRHGDAVARFYMHRRDNFERKAHAVLSANPSTGQRAVATWVTPVAGMFLWLRLLLPPTQASQEGDSMALINEKARARGVLAVPGMSFMPDGKTTCYVRTSYSLIPEEHVEEGLRRLRAVVEEAWQEAGLTMP